MVWQGSWDTAIRTGQAQGRRASVAPLRGLCHPGLHEATPCCLLPPPSALRSCPGGSLGLCHPFLPSWNWTLLCPPLGVTEWPQDLLHMIPIFWT